LSLLGRFRQVRYELRWRVFGYRWFERSPLFCFLHPFRAARDLRRAHINANTYQGALSAAWGQLGRSPGREQMDKELKIKW